jgi:cell wall assembly regulator SMI1
MLTETQQIQLFINGLGNHMCIDTALQSTATLDNAIVYARANQQRAVIPAVGEITQAVLL